MSEPDESLYAGDRALLSRLSVEARPTAVRFDYTNHRGEAGERTALPMGVRWGVAERYGPGERWLLDAFDVDRQAVRTFAVGRMTRLREVPNE